jgi:putative hydrolase of the HAD superfamily
LAIDTFKDVGIYAQFADFEAFFDRLYEFFAGADPWYVYADTMPALEHWRKRGLKLGVISNFDTRLYAVLAALGLADFFSSVTISTAAGAAKPDVGVFRQALSKYTGQSANQYSDQSSEQDLDKNLDQDWRKSPDHTYTEAIDKANSAITTASKSVWHIGDSLSEDYAGAIAANLEAIWINRGDRLPPKDRAIKSIAKLTDLIVI